MTKWKYWGGWAVGVVIFWAMGYWVIKWAIVAAHWTIQGRR
jgi:hypothetical protein